MVDSPWFHGGLCESVSPPWIHGANIALSTDDYINLWSRYNSPCTKRPTTKNQKSCDVGSYEGSIFKVAAQTAKQSEIRYRRRWKTPMYTVITVTYRFCNMSYTVWHGFRVGYQVLYLLAAHVFLTCTYHQECIIARIHNRAVRLKKNTYPTVC